MKLGIMQPYFFPYLGYFDLINRCDNWVVFSHCQYIKRGWGNRNRVLHTNKKDWCYLTVPTQKHSLHTRFDEIRINKTTQWKRSLLSKLEHYKNNAPYYHETIDVVKMALSKNTESLTELNIASLQTTCSYLGIQLSIIEYQHDHELEIKVNLAGDWAFEICKQTGASTYINPEGGCKLFNKEKFQNANIDLIINKHKTMKYKTGDYIFQPGLSIIDVMMWSSAEEIKTYLDNCH